MRPLVKTKNHRALPCRVMSATIRVHTEVDPTPEFQQPQSSPVNHCKTKAIPAQLVLGHDPLPRNQLVSWKTGLESLLLYIFLLGHALRIQELSPLIICHIPLTSSNLLSNNPNVQGPIIHLRRRQGQNDIVDWLLPGGSLQNEPALVDIVILVDEFVAVLFDNMP
jgi:hypothetical protein